jgi:hypothetical protein
MSAGIAKGIIYLNRQSSRWWGYLNHLKADLY